MVVLQHRSWSVLARLCAVIGFYLGARQSAVEVGQGLRQQLVRALPLSRRLGRGRGTDARHLSAPYK